MTKRELSQVYYLNREIEMQQRQLEDLEANLESMKLATTVSGSSPEYPYTKRIFRIGGAAISGRYTRVQSEIIEIKALIRLNQEKCAIEYNRIIREINSVQDSLMRQILTYRYINCLPWVQVAAHIGGGNTADGVRIAHDRFLKQEEQRQAAV